MIDQHRDVLSEMQKKGLIFQKNANTSDLVLESMTTPDMSQFDEYEIKTLDDLIERCEGQTARSLSDLTHNEI